MTGNGNHTTYKNGQFSFSMDMSENHFSGISMEYLWMTWGWLK
jgi:hypothetical protein